MGVYRNDGTGGKLGYYASGSAALTSGSCGSGGRRALKLTVALDYSAPTSGPPAYVLGFAHGGHYVLRTNVLVFAPLTGDLTALQVNGHQVPVIWAIEGGRKVGMITVDLKPGVHAVVTADLTVATRRPGSSPPPRSCDLRRGFPFGRRRSNRWRPADRWVRCGSNCDGRFTSSLNVGADVRSGLQTVRRHPKRVTYQDAVGTPTAVRNCV